MLSGTYRQTSTLREDAFEKDPDDRLLWRFPLRRLDGEALRDAMRRADILLVPVSPSAFDTAATQHFLDQIGEYKAIKKGDIAVGLVAMRVDPRTNSAAELEEFLQSFDFPLVAHLRATQVYVHCARDGLTIADLPHSRAEQDLEQWRPLTRWIARHSTAKNA
jgi:chromosome partitioning protein